MALIMFAMAFGIPWIWNGAYLEPWVDKHLAFFGGHEFINVAVMTLIILAFFSFLIMKTTPADWSGKSFSSIEDVKAYRNAKMNGMSQSDGAKLLLQTQILDMAGKEETDDATGRAMRYMNGRLAGMSPAQGLEWVKSGGK